MRRTNYNQELDYSQQQDVPEYIWSDKSSLGILYRNWSTHWSGASQEQLKQVTHNIETYQDTVGIIEKMTVEPDFYEHLEAKGNIYRPIAGSIYVLEINGVYVTFEIISKDSKLVVLWCS